MAGLQRENRLFQCDVSHSQLLVQRLSLPNAGVKINLDAREDAVVPSMGSLIHLFINVLEVVVQMRFRLIMN